MTRPNKLESLETLSSQVLEFEGKAEPTQLEHLSDASFLSKLLVFPANVRLDWKVIACYKHSSLFGLINSDEGKKIYNIDTWWQKLATDFPSLGLTSGLKLECFNEQQKNIFISTMII